MRICPGCRSTYDESVRLCPKDGRALVEHNTTLPLAPALVALETPSQVSVGAAAGPDFNIEPGMMVGDYRVEGVIAHGGIGVVFAAVHPVISKRVAIKVLARRYAQDAEQISRFVLEARAVNQIGHHNIVDIFAIGELHDGRKYLVMEYLDGLEIHRILANVGRFRAGEILPIYEQLCDALAAAHAKGFVHRDLKPENVTVLRRHPYPFIKVLDFGIAKLRGTSHTAVGTVLGTPEYMAPEQCRSGPIDARVDVYSLGVMLYEMLTGEKPFTDADPLRILAKQTRAKPRRPGEIAPILPDLERVILKAMAKRPDDRHASVGHLIKDLRQAIPSVLPWTASLDLPVRPEHEPTRTLPQAARDSRPQVAPDSQPETAPDSQPGTAADSQPGTAADSQPETAPDSQPPVAPHSRPETAEERQFSADSSPALAATQLGPAPTPPTNSPRPGAHRISPEPSDSNTATPVDGDQRHGADSEPSVQLADKTTLTPLDLVRESLASDDSATQLYQLPIDDDRTDTDRTLLQESVAESADVRPPGPDPSAALSTTVSPSPMRPVRQSIPTPTTIDFDPSVIEAAAAKAVADASTSNPTSPRANATTLADGPIDVAATALDAALRRSSPGHESLTAAGEATIVVREEDVVDPALRVTEPLPNVARTRRAGSDTERGVPAISSPASPFADLSVHQDTAATMPQIIGPPPGPPRAPEIPLFMQDESTLHVPPAPGLHGARLGAVLAFLVAVGTALIVGAVLLLSYGR